MNSLTKAISWHAATDANAEGSWNNHGSPLVYTNWAAGQPDNYYGGYTSDQDCALINWGGLGLWDDRQCEDFTYGYVCELGMYAQWIWSNKTFSLNIILVSLGGIIANCG